MERLRVDQLNSSALFFLFGTDWLPYTLPGQHVVVPGGRVDARTAYANLVDVIVWALSRNRLLRVVPLRPVEPEAVLVLGGASFCRLEAVAPGEADGPQGTPAGIEHRVLNLVRDAPEPADNDLREVLRRLPRSRPYPCRSLTSWPITQLSEAGMVRRAGVLSKRLEIAAPELVDEARVAFERRRAQRAESLAQHPELHDAVIADGLAAYAWLSTRTRF